MIKNLHFMFATSKLYRVTLLLNIFFFSSCIKEIPLEPDIRVSKPVINALFTEGQRMKLYLSSTRGILEEKSPPITNAFIVVELAGIGTPIDTLIYKGDYIYEGSQDLIAQKRYQIRVNVPGSEEVFAISFIPEPVSIVKATVRNPVAFDEYGDPIKEIKIQFSDPKETANFYELFLFAQTGSNAIFFSNHFIHENDPVIIAEGLEDFNNSSFLFSDKLFDGEICELRFTFENMSYNGIPFEIDVEPLKSFALLRSVSPEYYNYRKNWVGHHYHQQNRPSLTMPDPIIKDFVEFLFKGDVQQMETNVVNGYGVFGGYSTSLMEIENL